MLIKIRALIGGSGDILDLRVGHMPDNLLSIGTDDGYFISKDDLEKVKEILKEAEEELNRWPMQEYFDVPKAMKILEVSNETKDD